MHPVYREDSNGIPRVFWILTLALPTAARATTQKAARLAFRIFLFVDPILPREKEREGRGREQVVAEEVKYS